MNRLFRARLSLHRPWLPRLAAGVGLGLFATFLLRLHLDDQHWMLLEAAVGVLLCWTVWSRASAYGGQVLHALKLACRDHDIQLTSELVDSAKPDPQHTVAS
jgi:hypothetical protein